VDTAEAAVKAVCSVCGNDVTVRKDGNLRRHGYGTDPFSGKPFSEGACDGSDKPPKDRG
jgi:hypothetical protein